jgi:3-deoxy-7-phosphoheptulonate synthase
METNVCDIQENVCSPVSIKENEASIKSTSIVEVSGVKIGGNEIIVMAGPCAVESWEQLYETARVVKGKGKILRGGAFKPRSSPHSFQGLGIEGLKFLKKASKETGLPVVTEVMDTRQVELVAEYADLLQIGSRNMQNFPLLKEVGKSGKPVLLKRGLMATIDEFLLAAEYITNEGNDQVILCERGIRTFETSTRNTLDLNAVPMLKHRSNLPVIVDPSHSTGHDWMVAPMSKAAIAAGADGLIIEVHYQPEKALCDGKQSLTPEDFFLLMDDLGKIAAAVGRTM